MVAEGNDALLEEFFEKGTLPVEHILDGLREGVRSMRISPVLCAVRSAQRRQRSDPQFHHRQFPQPRRSRDLEGNPQRQGSRTRHQGFRAGLSSSSSKPSPMPFAGRVTYFKVISGVLKNDAKLFECPHRRRRAAVAHRRSLGKNYPARSRTARRRYRRGRQTEGHAHRRYSGRQSLAHRLPARESAGALHRLRHRRQNAQR